MKQQSELAGATERFLIDDEAGEAAPAALADILEKLGEAAEHAAEALPELIVLSRGGERFPERARCYVGEVINCLASALEAALTASKAIEVAGIPGERKGGEDALALMVTDFLDRSAR